MVLSAYSSEALKTDRFADTIFISTVGIEGSSGGYGWPTLERRNVQCEHWLGMYAVSHEEARHLQYAGNIRPGAGEKEVLEEVFAEAVAGLQRQHADFVDWSRSLFRGTLS